MESNPIDIVSVVRAGAIGLVILTVLVVFIVRNARVNRRRMASGRTRLRWNEIRHLRTAGSDAAAASEEELAGAVQLYRQREWERQQAAMELARYGRAMVRTYCSTHDRWCKHPERGPHPPGGHENEQVPEGWLPPGEGPSPAS